MTSVDNGNKVTSEVLDFPEHLRMIFQRMQNDETLHDVVFIVQNERFSANKCVVAAASPVLRRMLTNGMKETEQREIRLEEVAIEGWKMVFDYMYTARIEFDDVESALQCLECANRFQFEELEHAVSTHIGKKLDMSNCCEVLIVADRINMIPLRNMAMEVFVEHFYLSSFSYRLTYLPYDIILEVLNSDQLVVKSELDLFMAVMRRCVCSGVSDLQPELNSLIATRAYELLVQFELIQNEFHFIEPESCKTGSYPELFNCVNINNMSNSELRLVVRFCRRLCTEAQANHEVDLMHLRQLGEKANDKLLEMRNPIPNVPLSGIDRVPHRRYSQVFAFSYTFPNVQTLISSSSVIFPSFSPEFADKSGKVQWRIEVHFRGLNGENRDKYVGCFLHRSPPQALEEDKEEDVEISAELFFEIEQDDCTSASLLFTCSRMNDGIVLGSDGLTMGCANLVPISSLQGKSTVTVGAAVYSKPK